MTVKELVLVFEEIGLLEDAILASESGKFEYINNETLLVSVNLNYFRFADEYRHLGCVTVQRAQEMLKHLYNLQVG